LPQHVLAALNEINDFAFNFDQPGFYAVLAFAKSNARSPGFAQAPQEVADWRELLERPGEFRGRPVTLSGIVGHNKDPYRLANHPELGMLTQLELHRPDQPLSCTLILTEHADDLPLGATLRVTGYFVMIRQYYAPSGHVRQAALLVAPGPSAVTITARRVQTARGPDWRWLTAAIVLGLLIALVWLRRAGIRTRIDLRQLRASREAPADLSTDLERWATRQSEDDH